MRSGKNILLLLPLIFYFSSQLYAQQHETATVKAFNAIYNLDFETAAPLIDEMDSTADPLYATLFRIEWHWWRYISTSGEAEKTQLKDILDSLRQDISDSQEEQLKRLVYLSYSIRYDYAHGRYLGMLMRNIEIRSLLNRVEEDLAMKSRRERQIFDLYSNIFIYADNITTASLIRSSDEKCEQALEVLEKLCDSEDPIVNTLANYFTGKIYLAYEDPTDTYRKYFQRLVERYPGNIIFKKILRGEE